MHSLMQWPSCTCTWWVSWLKEFVVDKLVGGSCVGGLKSAFKTKNAHPRLQTTGWKCPWKCNRGVGKGPVFKPTSHSFISF